MAWIGLSLPNRSCPCGCGARLGRFDGPRQCAASTAQRAELLLDTLAVIDRDALGDSERRDWDDAVDDLRALHGQLLEHVHGDRAAVPDLRTLEGRLAAYEAGFYEARFPSEATRS